MVDCRLLPGPRLQGTWLLCGTLSSWRLTVFYMLPAFPVFCFFGDTPEAFFRAMSLLSAEDLDMYRFASPPELGQLHRNHWCEPIL